MPDTEAASGYVKAGDERGNSWVGGGMGVVFKVFGEETGGKLAIVEHPVWPRVLVTPHVHENEDEYSYVLEGTIGARIGDRELVAETGSYVIKPRGIPHAFWNPTDQPARILEMISPAGFERFFSELGRLIELFERERERISAADRGVRINALAAGFGLTYLTDWIPELEAKYGLQAPGGRMRG